MSSGRKTRKSDSDIEQELVPTVHKRHSYAPTDPEASPYKRRDSYVPTEPEASPYKRHSYAPTDPEASPYKSHDLRLLYMIDEYRLIFDDTAIQQELRALVARVKYDYKYSTSEQLESGGDKIYNVSDAHVALKRLVEAYPDDSRASDILVVTGTTPVVQI